jgi:hypothetical protein
MLGVLTLAGCVERRYIVYTDPPGAIVVRNGKTVGPAPADDYFTYYGKYHFTIYAEGYQTLQVDQDICPPWFEYPGLDFFAENLLPWPIQDRREFHYTLQPYLMPNPEQLINDGGALRSRGQALPSVPYDRLPVTAPAAPMPIPPPGAQPVPPPGQPATGAVPAPTAAN